MGYHGSWSTWSILDMEYELRLWQTISDRKNVIPISIHPYVGVVDIVRPVLCVYNLWRSVDLLVRMMSRAVG